ncbi:MAG: hypothetical protein ABW278_04240 [Steroidobacteraceae bacterium]
MKHSASKAALFVVLAMAGAGHAQTPAVKPKPAPAAPKIDFVTLDKDANGGLSKEETKVIAELNRQFEQLDADHDELVSPAEFARWNRAGKITGAPAPDPATAPSGSAGAQHMPNPG